MAKKATSTRAPRKSEIGKDFRALMTATKIKATEAVRAERLRCRTEPEMKDLLKANAARAASQGRSAMLGFAADPVLLALAGSYPAERLVRCRVVVYAAVDARTSYSFDDVSVLGDLMDAALMPNLGEDINTRLPLHVGYGFRYNDIQSTWNVGQLVLHTIARDKAWWESQPRG